MLFGTRLISCQHRWFYTQCSVRMVYLTLLLGRTHILFPIMPRKEKTLAAFKIYGINRTCLVSPALHQEVLVDLRGQCLTLTDWLSYISTVDTLEDDVCPDFILTLAVPCLWNRPALFVDMGTWVPYLQNTLYSVVDKIRGCLRL